MSDPSLVDSAGKWYFYASAINLGVLVLLFSFSLYETTTAPLILLGYAIASFLFVGIMILLAILQLTRGVEKKAMRRIIGSLVLNTLTLLILLGFFILIVYGFYLMHQATY